MSQCREVYARHDTISAADYLKDEVFRTVEIEMVEVQVRALPCVYRCGPCIDGGGAGAGLV
jgi:hypothetical protein